MSNALEAILKKLVEIPSVSGDFKQSETVIKYVHELLEPAKALQTKGRLNDFPHLIATTREPNNDMIWFVSHLDVVPADSNMFQTTSDDKNYYGRGVFDMKGMAAAVICAFNELTDPEKANVGLMFTTDEEVGGRNGVKSLVDNNFKAAAAFVFDQSADWVMLEKMKGVLWLEVTARGEAAHGARPWLGKSANQTLVSFLHDLKQWYDSSMPQKGPHNFYTTFNLGTLHGGKATNQVSDEAVATIDSRFVREEDASMIITAAKSIASRYQDITIKELMHEPCYIANTQEKWYKTTKKFMVDLGIKPGPHGERFGHGSTDGRFFAPYDIPVITTRPPGGDQHGPKEWVSKQGLRDLERLCLELMKATI